MPSGRTTGFASQPSAAGLPPVRLGCWRRQRESSFLKGLPTAPRGYIRRRPGALQGGRTAHVGVEAASAGRPPGMRCSPRGAPPVLRGRRGWATESSHPLQHEGSAAHRTPSHCLRAHIVVRRGAPHTAHRAGRHLHGAGRADEPTPGLSRAHVFSALAASPIASRQLRPLERTSLERVTCFTKHAVASLACGPRLAEVG